MIEFNAPTDAELKSWTEDIDWTAIAPEKDCELSLDQLKYLTRALRFGKGPFVGEQEYLLNYRLSSASSPDSDAAKQVQIDIEVLWQLVYEHQRYVQAKGFSDTEMDVLRAIEFNNNKRVHVKEIMEEANAEDISESAVYNALRSLREKELVKKLEGRGYYQYDGPEI